MAPIDQMGSQSAANWAAGAIRGGRAWRTVSVPPWVVLLATSFWMPGPLAQAGKPHKLGENLAI